jgi:anti-anti-sigma regulatory factor
MLRFDTPEMLRITVAAGTYGAVVAIEGRLAGPWVDELRTSWRTLAATRDPRSIRVDLDAVTFIDAGGKALLWAMHEQGADLRATGCMTRAIVEEIGRSRQRAVPGVERQEDG